jgi:hypothetical protein
VGRALSAGVALVALVAGCGGHAQGDADQVARIVRADVHAKGGSCERVRKAKVSGETVTLYTCTMQGVPSDYRAFGSLDTPTQRYCYAVQGDYGVMANDAFGAECTES